MKLTPATVLHIAKLARLQLRDDEVAQYGEQLSKILGYVAQLEALDVSGVPPTLHVEAIAAPLREDVPEPNQSVEDALRNAPEHVGTSFAVPKVIDA